MICEVENGFRKAGPETVLAFLDALGVDEKHRKAIIRMAAKDAGWKV
jgi:hypothetical protein